MVPEEWYVANLKLCENVNHVAGCVVECGVWRGGMNAGIADLLGPDREYFLFDSFEGLPPAKDIDGAEFRAWQLMQSDPSSPHYINNCAASEEEAEEAMKMSAARNYTLIKGWFNDTIPSFRAESPIAILRLDGDLHDSTEVCLKHLYPRLAVGGLIVIARAVHEFLASLNMLGANDRPLPRLWQHDGIFFLV